MYDISNWCIMQELAAGLTLKLLLPTTTRQPNQISICLMLRRIFCRAKTNSWVGFLAVGQRNEFRLLVDDKCLFA